MTSVFLHDHIIHDSSFEWPFVPVLIKNVLLDIACPVSVCVRVCLYLYPFVFLYVQILYAVLRYIMTCGTPRRGHWVVITSQLVIMTSTVNKFLSHECL